MNHQVLITLLYIVANNDVKNNVLLCIIDLYVIVFITYICFI